MAFENVILLYQIRGTPIDLQELNPMQSHKSLYCKLEPGLTTVPDAAVPGSESPSLVQ